MIKPISKSLPAQARYLFFFLNFFVCLAWGQVIPGDAPNSAKENVISPEQAQNLVQTLENETARKHLIDQLKILVALQEKPAPVESSTTALLVAISRQVEKITKHIFTVAGSINQFPAIATWISKQFHDPVARQIWRDAIVKLIAIIGLGYIAYFVTRSLIRLLVQPVITRRIEKMSSRIGWVFLYLILGLIPIAAFIGVTYLMLSILDLRASTRLATLAWINAIIISRMIILAGDTLFAANIPALRLLPVTDESAHYIDVWIRRLTLIPIYSYFALQASLFLGLDRSLYESLLQLLGLITIVLFTVFILQNREVVAQWIKGNDKKSHRLQGLRLRLASVWHLLAINYLLVIYVIWALGLPSGFLYLLKGSGLTLIAVIVGYLLIKADRRIFKNSLDISVELQQRYPGLQTRANRYVPILHSMLHALIYLLVILAVLQAWGINTFGWIVSAPGLVLTKTLITIATIIVSAIIIWEVTNYFIESYLAENSRHGRAPITSARTRTLLTVARKALLVVVVVLTVLLVLSELGLNIAPLLATAGVVGLAIGFGAQKLVQDLITGVFILLEDLFAVGDVIKVDSISGVVEAVSIRNVRLRDLSGTVHTIPFSSISTISNLTKEFSYHLFDLGVAYRENVDHVMEVLITIGEELRNSETFGPLILEPLEIFGVDQLADSAVIIKGRIKTLPIKQWMVGREFNRRVKNKFDELGIEIPYPHMTVYFGEDKQGNAPPIHLNVKPSM